MLWRPVPGFTPSADAYLPALKLAELGRAMLRDLRDAGVLPGDVDRERVFRTYTAVTTGVVTQQLANAPGEPVETGVFTATLPDVIAMWLGHHRSAAPDRPTDLERSTP